MAFFQVTSRELRNKAENLRGLNGQFRAKCNELDSQEQELCSMWEGEAKNAFDKAFKSDEAQMDNFYNLIEQYCVALENIATKYDQAEMMNTSTAQTRSY